MNCKYCNKIFSTKATLLRHQSTAKYCISQRKLAASYDCKYCGKHYSQSIRLEKHENICNLDKTQRKLLKKDNLIAVQKQEIHQLEIKLQESNDEIAKLKLQLANKEGCIEGLKSAKPSITNNISIKQKLTNVRIEGMKPLTEELVSKNLDKYTFNSYLKGPSGIIEFLKPLMVEYTPDNPPARNYVCTNPIKQNFHKLNLVKEWERDHGASFLTTVLDVIKPKTNTYQTELDDLTRGTVDGYYSDKKKELAYFNRGIQSACKSRNKVITEIRTGVKEFSTI